MIDVRPVLFVIGVMIMALVPFKLLCALVDWSVGNPDWIAFAVSAGSSLMFGGLLSVATRQKIIVFDRRQAFLLTVGMWVAMSVAGALPFYTSGLKLTFAQSVFETVSGITTTGSTVISGLDNTPPGILLWRGLLNWVGGLGFIATGILLFPFLRIAGMQLFKMESSDVGEKATARMIDTVRQMLMLYLLVSVLGMMALLLVGLKPLDAAVHVMAAIATGGFGNYDASVGYFNSRWVEGILMVLMVIGGMTFPLIVLVFHGRWRPLFHDAQTRFYFLVLGGVILTMAAWRWAQGQGDPVWMVWSTAFNVISIITTTGFVSEDYSLWGPLPVAMFLFITFLGGCTGSTAGGIKMFRLYVLAMSIRAQLLTRLYPRRVVKITYNDKVVDDETLRGIMGFLWLLMMAFGVIMLGMSAAGYDLVTSFSGAAQALANVGPGLGPIIGPAGNFSTINDMALWFLTAGMLLGRLEIIVVLVIFLPSFWRG